MRHISNINNGNGFFFMVQEGGRCYTHEFMCSISYLLWEEGMIQEDLSHAEL